MSWRDFLYFSKGERSGLIVLLCLITTAGILLILSNKRESVTNQVMIETTADDINESSEKNTDANPLNTQSSPRKDIKAEGSSSSSDAMLKSGANAPGESFSKEKTEKTSGTGTISTSKSPEKKETVSERVNRLTSYSQPSYSRVEKFKEGTVVELNSADTTTLKKVPGIGSSFAKRIVSYRNLLGGYYSVTQLSEVYGVDEDRYNAFVPWFTVDPSLISTLSVNSLSQDSLRRHPYIDYGQARIITQIRKQKGKLTGWENLQLLKEFSDIDIIRLEHYLSFE